MKRGLVAALAITVAFVACSSRPNAADKRDTSLSAEEARFALAGWLMNHSDGWVRAQATRVEDAAPVHSSSTQVAFGRWRCDLSSHRFNATFPMKNERAATVEGEFVLAPNGIWIARGKSRYHARVVSK